MQTAITNEAKAAKVAFGLERLSTEYSIQDDTVIAAALRKVAGFPVEDLADLYDWIATHEPA